MPDDDRIPQLEADVAELRAQVEKLQRRVGTVRATDVHTVDDIDRLDIRDLVQLSRTPQTQLDGVRLQAAVADQLRRVGEHIEALTKGRH